MKNPCVKDCPDRKMGCRKECDKYQEYREWYDKVESERRKRLLLDSYQIESMNKNKRRRGEK